MAKKGIEIDIKADGSKASKAISAVQSSAETLKTSLIAISAAGAAAAASVAAFFSSKFFSGAVSGAADLEQAMSRVKAATGASGKELEALKKAATDAGTTTKFTATQAAGALENLAKAGLSSTQSIQALNPVLNLATAADVELATAAEYVTKAVMGMGLSFDDAGRVADVLAMGANATNTSVSGLAQALSYAAPVAKTLGLTLEETTAIMGKLADAGIDASRAGTSLANILAQFSDPASQFKRELAMLGITTNDFNEALRQLEAAGDKGNAAILAVGLNAGPALQSLLNQGMGSVDALSDKLRGAEGSAAAAAKVMQDDLRGSMDKLGSAWESIKIALAEPILPALKEAVDDLAASLREALSSGAAKELGATIKTAFVEGYQAAKDFISHVDFKAVVGSVKEFASATVAAFGQVVKIVGPAGATIATVVSAISTGFNAMATAAMAAVGALAKVAAGLSLVASGITSAASSLTSLVAPGSQVAKTMEGINTATQDATIAVDDFAKNALGTAGEMLDKTAEGADKTAQRILSLVGASGEAASGVATSMETIASSTTGAAQGAADAAAIRAEADAKAAAAAREHGAAILGLGKEYSDLMAKGDLAGATEAYSRLSQELEQASLTVQAATIDAQGKQIADTAAAQAAAEHAAMVASMRLEYEQLVQSGSTEAAAAMLQSITAELALTAQALDGATAATKSKSTADLDAGKAAATHAARIAELRGQYADLVSKGDLTAAGKVLQQINAEMVKASAAAKGAKGDVMSLEQAFATLGIRSSEELKRMADVHRSAYERIRSSGTASADDIKRAFLVAAQAATEAAGGIAPAWVKSQAGMLGLKVEVDATGKEVVKLAETIKATSDASVGATARMARGFREVADAAADAGNASEGAGNAGVETNDKKTSVGWEWENTEAGDYYNKIRQSISRAPMDYLDYRRMTNDAIAKAGEYDRILSYEKKEAAKAAGSAPAQKREPETRRVVRFELVTPKGQVKTVTATEDSEDSLTEWLKSLQSARGVVQ